MKSLVIKSHMLLAQKRAELAGSRDRGATAVEYGLIVALIAVARAIGSAPKVSPPTACTRSSRTSRMAAATACAPAPSKVVCLASRYQELTTPDRNWNGPSVRKPCARRCSTRALRFFEKSLKELILRPIERVVSPPPVLARP